MLDSLIARRGGAGYEARIRHRGNTERPVYFSINQEGRLNFKQYELCAKNKKGIYQSEVRSAKGLPDDNGMFMPQEIPRLPSAF